MSSLSSFSGTTGSNTNFGVSALNQTTMTDRKTYLCPKCNNSYDVNLRGNTYVGRVPLILHCKHTMCEECIRTSFSKREVQCVECQQSSNIVDNDKRKIQEVFPVNFYMLGIIYYSKPNMSEVSKLSLRPAGVNYKNKDKLILGSNSSLCSDPGDVWSKASTQNFIQEKCSQTGCQKSAVLRCADCVEVYCQSCCQTLHKAARGLQKHKVTAVSGEFGLELTEKCSVHKDNILEFHCDTCNKVVCAYCLIHSHQQHSYRQLTYLNEPDQPNFQTLVNNAEEKMKKLMVAHKKIQLELEQAQSSHQATSLEASVGKYFANLHGRLQILERKLREDAKNAKNTNFIKLSDLGGELLSNIRTLYRLINTAKNLDNINSNNSKFNVTTIIERLQNALSLPDYLVGQKQNTENVGFVYGGIFDNLEDNFCINTESSTDGYQLVTEDELPEGYDIALPSELSSIDISQCFTPTRLEPPLLSSTGILRTPRDLTPTDILTNALQPKSAESTPSTSTVEDWVLNVTEETTKMQALKPEDREYVFVTHIDSPECFYVQLVRYQSELQQLSNEINQHIRNFAPTLKTVELNTLYIVKYETRDARPEWYRGRVIDIIFNKNGEKVYNVMFIDYGNTQIVNINMLRKISSTLAKPKPYAIQCKLFNVYPTERDWNSKAMKLMAQILSGVDVLMIVLNTCGALFEVDLITINHGYGSSLRDALIFIGPAVSCLDPSSSIDYLKMKAVKPMPKYHSRSDNFKKQQVFDVILCNIIDPDNIYVQLVENLHHIDHLNDVMGKHYNKPGKGSVHGTAKGENIYVPKKGMVVVARCSSIGPLWYRATVIRIIDGQGMVEVFLVDYGRTETIYYTEIRKLSERFRNLECQALLMKMAHIAPFDGSRNWNQSATEFLVKYINNKDRLKLIVVEAEKPPTVLLFEYQASFDICINSLMVRDQLAISTGKLSETVEWLKDNPSPVKPEPSYVHELMNTIQCSKTTYADDSDSDEDITNIIRKEVRVLLTKSPDTIYVACIDNDTKNEQHQLHSSLQNYYSKQHGQNAKWKIGDPCVVNIRTKKQYYRGIILEKIDNLNFKVMLRDIAQEITVSKGDMYILDKKFKQFPEGAVRCHLTGVVPAGGSNKWSGLAIELLQEVFTTSRGVYMTKDGPVDKNRKSFPVIMWYSVFKPGEALEPSKLINHNVNKLLIKKGLAFREKPKPIIESDLDTKGGDTSSDTVKNDEAILTLQNQLPTEKPEEGKKCPDEEPEPTNFREISFRTTQKQLKDSRIFKTKGHLKPRITRSKQPKHHMKYEETVHGVSSEGEWLSATSSDDDDNLTVQNITKMRAKSTGSIETYPTHQDLKRLSASAASSPHHTPQESIISINIEQLKKESLESNASDWNALIAQDESPKKSEVTSAPVITSTISEMSEWLTPLPFEKNSFFAYSTFVDYQANIYLHETKLEPVLKAIEEKMKPIFDQLPPEPVGCVWVPGQLCTVRYFVNESWYRGKIISVGEETIKVFMIDYGNEEECKHEDLRFKVMYLDVPAFAKKVFLHNVFPKKGSKWLTSDLDELHKKIVENQIFVTLKGKVQPGVVAIPAIIKLNEININQLMLETSTNLVSNSNQKRKELSEPDSDDVIIEEEDSDDGGHNSSSTPLNTSSPPEVQSHPVTIVRQLSLPRAKYCHNPLPKSLKGQKLSVIVVSMLNYNKFIFEILTDQNIIETKEQFVSISEDISEVAHKQPQLKDLEIGQACVTQYSVDGEWYRGEVVNFDDNNGTVDIWFVDFGNFETVPQDTVRAILPKWLMLPVLQYIGDIDGIEIADESYFEAIFENMAKYCDTTKIAEILSTKPLRVRLYNENNELAYQDLIDKKMLVLIN